MRPALAVLLAVVLLATVALTGCGPQIDARYLCPRSFTGSFRLQRPRVDVYPLVAPGDRRQRPAAPRCVGLPSKEPFLSLSNRSMKVTDTDTVLPVGVMPWRSRLQTSRD